MSGNGQRSDEAFDAVIVGASLAGCTAAIKLGRAGARVALVERHPDPAAYKKVCSHFIQASGVPTLERLGLLDALTDAGAARSRFRIWTRWGWIVAPPEQAQVGLNLRRSKLDPLVREAALEAPGVEGLLGWSAETLVREGGAIRGVVMRDRAGAERTLRTRLVVGADGRGSRIAKLAGVKQRVKPHGRFAYGTYFAGPAPNGAPDASVWLLDPQWAAAFPTDDGLTFYAAMPTKARLPEFRADPEAALVKLLSDLPDPPPIAASRRVAGIIGKLDLTNVTHDPVAPGLALIGDAAMAADPLWGVGCGWALQSGEWLADAVGEALAGGPARDAELAEGLRRYRARWSKGLTPHARLIEPYATGRKLDPFERLMFSAAARDGKVATRIDAVGARTVAPIEGVRPVLGRMVAVNVRHALSGKPKYAANRSEAWAAGRSPGSAGGHAAEAPSAPVAAGDVASATASERVA